MPLYSDFMVKEALRDPIGYTPIPGFIWSSQKDNLEIIYWAIMNDWKNTDLSGEKESVKEFANRIYTQNSKYIDALISPSSTDHTINSAITERINAVTEYDSSEDYDDSSEGESFCSFYALDIVIIGIEISVILIGAAFPHIYGESGS